MPSGRTGKCSCDSKITFNFCYKCRQVVSLTSLSFYPRSTSPLYPVPEERLGSQATTDAVGDRKLSDPARNLTHFLGGASTLLTAIPTYPEHHSLNCSKIIWINIPYSDNIFYSFSLKSFRV